MTELERAVDLGDLDELVRWVDRLCEQRAWAELVRLRDLSRAALERGRQLWPAASYAEYRLALDAPASWAAQVLVPDAGRFALGPLSEVAASTHTWAELAAHVDGGPVAGLTAHERIVRGEAVAPESVPPAGPELPYTLARWEPSYPVATYKSDRLEAPRPSTPPRSAVQLPSTARRLPGDRVTEALTALAREWVESSNGRVDAVAVEGTALHALAALGVPQARMAPVDLAAACSLMAWTAASGGAHGRRRGMAIGRFETWWTLAALTALDDEWPPDTDELGASAGELRFFEWDASEPDTGWVLRLAVEDPVDGLAWAVAATDAT